jgi:hypothetical protein
LTRFKSVSLALAREISNRLRQIDELALDGSHILANELVEA